MGGKRRLRVLRGGREQHSAAQEGEPVATADWWALIIDAERRGATAPPALVGYWETEDGAAAAANRIRGHIHMGVKIQREPQPSDRRPTLCQVLITREGSDVTLEPIRIAPSNGHFRPDDVGSPVVRPRAGQMVIETWRFPEAYGVWNARATMPEIFRGPDRARIEAIAALGIDHDADFGDLRRLTPPPLGARAAVAGEPMIAIEFRAGGLRGTRSILVKPDSRETAVAALVKSGYVIVAERSVRSDEPTWRHSPPPRNPLGEEVLYGSKIRI